MPLSTFPQITSPEQLQRQLNRLVSELEAALPQHGGSMPAATGQEGRLFTSTQTGKTYQLRGGAWVPIT